MSTYPDHFGDHFLPVLPVLSLEHPADRPFCWDETCPCHEDQDAISEVYHAYQEGFVSVEDATRIVQGRTL